MDLLDKMYQYNGEKHPISQPPLTTLESSLKELFPLGCLTDIFDIHTSKSSSK